ncbi:MAG TPA: four helix bundle protein [Terriglobales bacterium]|nr:four helix bundle protein [Terriglobales bacterium]
MDKRTEELRERTKDFAMRIVYLFRSLPPAPEAQIIGKQLLRSGTSVGANYHAACRARSKAEFISKIGVVTEEADETVFWIELLCKVGIMRKERLENLLNEARELTAIFSASRHTAKGR